jgi:hypothetical protein
MIKWTLINLLHFLGENSKWYSLQNKSKITLRKPNGIGTYLLRLRRKVK